MWPCRTNHSCSAIMKSLVLKWLIETGLFCLDVCEIWFDCLSFDYTDLRLKPFFWLDWCGSSLSDIRHMAFITHTQWLRSFWEHAPHEHRHTHTKTSPASHFPRPNHSDICLGSVYFFKEINFFIQQECIKLG